MKRHEPRDRNTSLCRQAEGVPGGNFENLLSDTARYETGLLEIEQQTAPLVSESQMQQRITEYAVGSPLD